MIYICELGFYLYEVCFTYVSGVFTYGMCVLPVRGVILPVRGVGVTPVWRVQVQQGSKHWTEVSAAQDLKNMRL